MKYFIGIVIVAIIIIAGLYYFSASPSAPIVPEAGTTSPPAGEAGAAAPSGNEAATRSSYGTALGGAGTAAAPSSGATVAYTASAFSPKTVTIKKGESVTFVNQSGSGMWVASARHPDHTVYSGTTRSAHCPDTAGAAFDQCETGDTYTFTFQKSGTWKYHNHVNIDDTGTIVVQ